VRDVDANGSESAVHASVLCEFGIFTGIQYCASLGGGFIWKSVQECLGRIRVDISAEVLIIRADNQSSFWVFFDFHGKSC